MNKSTFNHKTGLLWCLLLVAASSHSNSTKQTSITEIPSWVDNPVQQSAIAAAHCVEHKGNYSISRKKVIAHVRAELARQIEVNVSALEQLVAADNNDVYTSAGKTIANETIHASRVTKTAFATIDNIKHLCALMEVSVENTELIFNRIVGQQRRQLSEKEKGALFRTFVRDKTEQDLQQQIKQLSQ